MNIKKKLKSLGIENVAKVDEATKRELADIISTKLIETFIKSNLDQEKIRSKLINTKMYYADIPDGTLKAIYMYKNSSIYFDRSLELTNPNEDVLRECIHKIQEYKNRWGRLIQLGLCNFTDTKIKGLAFNEAAVQYIVSKILNRDKRKINLYGMEIPTIGNRYYSMITNLMEQIGYLLEDSTLVNSTINCNDEFIYECIDNFGEKNFNEIMNGFDKILSLEDNIIETLKETKEKENVKILIEEIQQQYFSVQEKIATSYFDTLLSYINTLQEIEEYKDVLLGYQKYMSKKENYEFYEKYYEIYITKALEKEEKIKSKTALMVVKDNPISKAFKTIKKLFININKEYNK